MAYDDSSFDRLADERDDLPQQASDRRSRFQRDRDRVIYSTAFRRTAGKTQVVAVEEFGLYHTRLTHSLKVAQLGRRLAERLRTKHMERNPGSVGDPAPPDPDLVEAACLAHDLGHPPFGHVGEESLTAAFDDLARRQRSPYQRIRIRPERAIKKLGGFEGNAQTFRILTYLSARVPLDPRCGLNLTRAVLDAATKYPWPRVHGFTTEDKWGAIELDLPTLEWVRQGVPLSRAREQSFEAQLMDWCDDVTYAVHDMVDFYRGGFIPLQLLFAPEGDGPNYRPGEEALRLMPIVQRDHAHTPDDVRNAWQALVPLVEIFEPWNPSRAVRAATQRVTSQLITYFVQDIDYTGNAPCAHVGDLVLHSNSDEAHLRRVAADFLKSILREFVIRSPAFAVQQRGQGHIVRSLLRMYCESDDLLPLDRQEDLADHGDRLRAATDHVASLTEQDAHALYERLTGYRLGALTDTLGS